MKYLIILLLVVTGYFSSGQSLIQIAGVKDFRYHEHSSEGALYAIQKRTAEEGPSGQVIFTPGGSGWEFSWRYEKGPQEEVAYNADSSQIVVDLSDKGEGHYIFNAKKMNEEVTREFFVFYDYLGVNVSYSDRFDCAYIKINITYSSIPRDYGIPANVDYWMVWGGKERQLTSLNDYGYSEISQWIADDTENVPYHIRIKDKYGLYWDSNEDIYESVVPKAIAGLELENTVDIVGEVNEQMGQAPLEVTFHGSNSINAGSYEWLLYKDTATMTGMASVLTDSLLEEQIRTQPDFTYTYENTGRYKVRLIAVNPLGNHCTDTTAPLYVNVIESLVDVPNVFTPNGDGKNDVFKVRALSVEDFRAVILNRWGRKVYEWNDPAEGWDGRINGKLASPGTYFYIVTARGREKNNPPEYVKKGALMLIR